MKYSAQQGFTLIEMTMVIFILGLLMASFLDPLATRVEQEERNNTQIQLDEIEEILYGYVLKNNHLPCPDSTGDGFEDTVAAGGGLACTASLPGNIAIGNLPWATLGVKGSDEWDNNFTYGVDRSFADRNGATTDGTGCAASATLNISFSLCSDGNITVNDAAVAGNTIATFIPAIVISHGKNWATAASPDETENTDDNVTFVDKDYSREDGAEFDDLMIWISPHILRTMTVKAGILP